MHIKENRDYETNALIGYIKDENTYIPLDTNNRNYNEIVEWLGISGNVAYPAFTDEEIMKKNLITEINKAKQYLADTDHKFYNGYKPKADEDLVAIELSRDTAREFIRANKGAI